MDSGMIGKILKAKQYAEEHDRIEFIEFVAVIHGENNDHTIQYNQGEWMCTCNYFSSHGVCSHTMALERVLGDRVHSGDIQAIVEETGEEAMASV